MGVQYIYAVKAILVFQLKLDLKFCSLGQLVSQFHFNNTCYAVYRFPGYGTCSIFGIAHYNTFDNKTYSFHGECNYVMVKLPLEPEKLKVIVNNDANCDPSLPCQKSLTIVVYGVQVDLGKKESNGHFMVKVDGEEIDKFPYLHQPDRAVYIRVMVCII